MTTAAPITRSEKKEHEESAHRKRVQAGLSTAGGVIGAGAFGALAGSKGLPKLGKLVRTKQPAKYERAARRMGKGALEAGTVGGGIGALSSLNFANVSRKEAQKEEQIARTAPVVPAQKKNEMNNAFALKKSLSDIAKAGQAVPMNTPAWQMARPGGDEKWREYVSPSARKAYDEALVDSRKKAQQRRTGSMISGAAGAGLFGGATAHALRGKGGRLGRLGAVGAAAAGGASVMAAPWLREKGASYEAPSRKIRARGYQRMLDTSNVEKALKIKSPGGYTKGTLARTGSGKMVLRNSYLTPSRKRGLA